MDYVKVKDVERQRAKELFGEVDEPTELASNVSSIICAVLRWAVYGG